MLFAGDLYTFRVCIHKHSDFQYPLFFKGMSITNQLFGIAGGMLYKCNQIIGILNGVSVCSWNCIAAWNSLHSFRIKQSVKIILIFNERFTWMIRK